MVWLHNIKHRRLLLKHKLNQYSFFMLTIVLKYEDGILSLTENNEMTFQYLGERLHDTEICKTIFNKIYNIFESAMRRVTDV